MVRAGEIYGIAGVGGNGQTELVEALTGVRPPLAGSVEARRDGRRYRLAGRSVARLGVASIPADRFGYGLACGLSVDDNFVVGQVAQRPLRHLRCAPHSAAMRKRARGGSGASSMCKACATCARRRRFSPAATRRS